MTEEKILQELQPIFHDIFDDESLVIVPETNAKDIEDWDSLMQVRLIVAIEKKFAIKFALNEIQNLNNVGDVIKIIQTKI